MLDFFTMIWEYIQILFQYLVNTVSSLLSLLVVILNTAQLPVTISQVVTPILGASVTAVASLATVKFLAGR